MKLKYIEIKGFKSFAKKERLDFEKQITAIVGPNGSGKSNIAEGFRFVLGEQSMKSLRSKKTEDLLFNGSSSMSRVNRASVTLVFDNSKKEIQEAFDEIEIERIIHRDATNEYYINGSQSRLKDVTEMLSEAKIGSAGHHIISQGEADKMLSMSARERKEYLEEALGLTQYQNKKHEALKKLEKTQENLISIRSLIRELAPHVRYLEREMKLIEKKKELSTDLETKTREYIQMCIPFFIHELARAKHSLDDVVQKIHTVKGQQTKTNQREDDDEFLSEREALETEIQKLTEEWNMLRNKRSENERLVGRLETKIELQNEVPKNALEETSIVDAPVRLVKIRNILTPAQKEQSLEIVRESIANALLLTEAFKQEKVETREQEVGFELLELETELANLKESIERERQDENRLIQKKQELEKAHFETFQKEERNKSDVEKGLLELRSLEVVKSTLDREVEALTQDRGYFYASLEEVVVLTGARFADDIKKAELLEENSTERSALKTLEHDVERLKLRIEGMQVGNTKEIEAEYTSAKEREHFLETEVRDLELTAEKLVNIADSLHQKIEDEFRLGIKAISEFFSTFFSQMFKGGSAGLSLVTLKSKNTEDESEEKEKGVEVVVSMPHKKLRSIAMLSGGEKTLVSIALVFALSQVNPPPFLILDETDAALDEANSRRYGDALKDLAKYSQLILITHNRETMSRAGMLYGVTMGSTSTSELLSIDLEEAEKIVK
ncbi:MAG: AAA family ATPase [Candidatus Paceibacterota bacterium]